MDTIKRVQDLMQARDMNLSGFGNYTKRLL